MIFVKKFFLNFLSFFPLIIRSQIARVIKIAKYDSRKIETESQNLQMKNGLFTTIVGHFFANYVDIFHKTEVQMIILRCSTCLNLYWFKSFDTTRKYFHFWFSVILWKKNLICLVVFFAFFAFLRCLQRLRSVWHIEMTVWTSVLWKISM